MEREPYAYWKGNPAVAATRQDLMKCNVSQQQDWNARVYAQVLNKTYDEILSEIDLVCFRERNVSSWQWSLQSFCRIGLKNQSKGTSNQTWQASAFTGWLLDTFQSLKVLAFIFFSFFIYDVCFLHVYMLLSKCKLRQV